MKPREHMETLYDAAISAFAEFGYLKTTMEDVAGRLNMTKGNLYLYVKNKKDLYHQTVAHALTKWQAKVLEAVGRETDPCRKFRVMCFKAAEYLSEDPALRRVLIRDPDIFPMFPKKDPFADINRNSVALIRAILKQGIQEGAFRPVDPDRVAETVFMVYKMFIIRMYIQTDDPRIQDMFADAVELFSLGLFEKKAE